MKYSMIYYGYYVLSIIQQYRKLVISAKEEVPQNWFVLTNLSEMTILFHFAMLSRTTDQKL